MYQSNLNHKNYRYKALKMQIKYFRTKNWNFEVPGTEKMQS